MLPIMFPEQNCVFNKPPNMTDEQCAALPVWKGTADGLPTILSCWQLSKEDLEEINRTGRVWLAITGVGMPPVSVFTENPFNRK